MMPEGHQFCPRCASPVLAAIESSPRQTPKWPAVLKADRFLRQWDYAIQLNNLAVAPFPESMLASAPSVFLPA
jgi:hypothetical protein